MDMYIKLFVGEDVLVREYLLYSKIKRIGIPSGEGGEAQSEAVDGNLKYQT